ncbi:MAG: hypothetical protein AAGD22_11405 [Verrucomicrobiota bacterium]
MIGSFFPMRPKALLTLSLLTATMAFVSCSPKYHGGGTKARGLSSVVIKSGHRPLIEGAIIDVFVEDGFQYSRSVGDAITFHKKGQRNAVFAYGNLNNANDVWIETTVIIDDIDDTAHRVRCDVRITQADRGMGFSEQSAMFVGKMGYVALVKKAKRRVERGDYG